MIKRLCIQLAKTYHFNIVRFVYDKLVDRKKRFIKYRNLKVRYPKQYYKSCKAPIQEDKIIFIENRSDTVSNSYKLLYDTLCRNYNFNVHVHLLRNDVGTPKEQDKRILNMLSDISTAKYVFVNDGSYILSCFEARKETVFIQTWHGCGAFKKFGYSTADLIFGEPREVMDKYPLHRNYSLVTISSPSVAWAYEDAMNLKDSKNVIQPTGVSRTDVFYQPEYIQQAYDNLYHVMPSARGKKVILYSPTFRGRVSTAETPNLLHVGMFYEEFQSDYILLMKHHPLVKERPVIEPQYREFCLDVTDEMTIDDLLCVSDICITDYSSLVFEYSIFERPIIFFAYDIEDYYEWRGFYYEYEEFVPGPIVTTNMEMIEYIKHPERFDIEKVRRFRKKFMQSCDGQSTQRILEYAIGEDLERYVKTNRDCSKEPLFYGNELEGTNKVSKAPTKKITNQPAKENLLNRMLHQSIHEDKINLSRYQEHARSKLETIMPSSVGKKIILFCSSNSDLDLQLCYEYLMKDYIILLYSEREHGFGIIDKYYRRFVIDMSGRVEITRLSKLGIEEVVHVYDPLSITELLSIADIYVGQLRDEAVAIFQRNLPIFIYGGVSSLYFTKNEAYFDYEQLLERFTMNSTKEVVEAILNIDQYDSDLLVSILEKKNI